MRCSKPRAAPPSCCRPLRRACTARATGKSSSTNSGIVDKCATAIWVEDTCFYVNFYRIAAQGRFGDIERTRLQAIAPAIGASVARHFQHGTPDQNLAALFATRAPLADLTGREQEVCRRILLGFSSEAISQALGISLHSTLTYRKRAYERLGISSQNELFAIVLRLLAGPRSLN